MNDKIKLLLIVAIPAFVMVAATFVYKTGIGIPEGTRNKGELIQPPIEIAAFKLILQDGHGFDYHSYSPGWSFVVVGGEECRESCRQILWKTRQVHAALGRKGRNISRYYLNADERNSASLQKYLDTEHKGLMTLFAPKEALRLGLAHAGLSLEGLLGDAFFLVDPQGWVMMYYRATHSGKDILSDVKFLLKQTGEG